MMRTALGVFVGVIVLVILFVLFVPHSNEEEELLPINEGPSEVYEVVLNTTYDEGLYDIEGSIVAPTPCTHVSATALVIPGTPDTVQVNIAMPPDTDICLQVLTEMPFEVSIEARENARIEASVNGAQALIAEEEAS
jgi:hypothetical protein